MGNCPSYLCAVQTPLAKVVDSEGNLQRFAAPVKVAELMLEFPGHVICRAHRVRRTRRVMAMAADEALEGGEVYLLLPVGRMNCKASDEEMARIDATCRGNRRKGRDCRKVSPGGQDHCDVAGKGAERDTGFAGHRKGTYGAWSPMLETIHE